MAPRQPEDVDVSFGVAAGLVGKPRMMALLPKPFQLSERLLHRWSPVFPAEQAMKPVTEVLQIEKGL